MVSAPVVARRHHSPDYQAAGSDQHANPPHRCLHDGDDRSPESWGGRTLGPTAEIFLMDARAGFVGEDQLAWISEAVEESSRTWKVGGFRSRVMH